MSTTKRRLGRGLDSLLPPARPAVTEKASSFLPIEELFPNRKQPRSTFESDAIEELAASIKEHGVLEPLLIRKRKNDPGYEIVAGERRWRAAQKAGLKEVPVFIRELTDKTAYEAALVENIQRENLNSIETALAYQRLIDEFGHTQESMAKAVGKSRTSVTNSLRLLKLPSEVISFMSHNELTEGHGRALLQAQDPGTILTLAQKAIEQGWSVRETEKKAKGQTASTASPASADQKKSANVLDLENRLSKALGTRVSVEDKSGKGKLVLKYKSFDQLDEIISKILR